MQVSGGFLAFIFLFIILCHSCEINQRTFDIEKRVKAIENILSNSNK